MLQSYVLTAWVCAAASWTMSPPSTSVCRRRISRAIAGKGRKQLPANALTVENMAQHAGQCADIASRLCAVLRPKFDATGAPAAVYDNIDRPLLGVLSRMECRDALVDRALLKAHSAGPTSSAIATGLARYPQSFSQGTPSWSPSMPRRPHWLRNALASAQEVISLQ